MDVQVRLGDETDLPFVKQLALQTCLPTIPMNRDISVEEVQKSIDTAFSQWPQIMATIPTAKILILETRETRTPIGYLILHVNQIEATTGEKQAVIQDIAVLPQYQGQYFWRPMLKKAEEIAKNHKNCYISGMITANNKASLLLAQRYGFKIERHQVTKKLS